MISQFVLCLINPRLHSINVLVYLLFVVSWNCTSHRQTNINIGVVTYRLSTVQCKGENIKSLAVCGCFCVCERVLGAKYFEKGFRQMLASNGTSTGNGRHMANRLVAWPWRARS